jgi:hypothetical protein
MRYNTLPFLHIVRKSDFVNLHDIYIMFKYLKNLCRSTTR